MITFFNYFFFNFKELTPNSRNAQICFRLTPDRDELIKVTPKMGKLENIHLEKLFPLFFYVFLFSQKILKFYGAYQFFFQFQLIFLIFFLNFITVSGILYSLIDTPLLIPFAIFWQILEKYG